MQYNNLTVLISTIVEFCNKHSMINSSSVRNEVNFRAIPDTDYPTVNIEPVEAPISGNQISQGFVITVADLMNTDFPNYNTYHLIDNSQRLAQDIINYLQNVEEFEASPNVTLNPFEDEGTDSTAGVVFRINITYTRDTNICVFDDLVNIERPFCFNEDLRTVTFCKWLMYPYLDQYEVTFDGGDNWITMDRFTYDIGDEEIPVKTIGQRI
ncbi:MAG TPA: hypothetical protein VK031_09680, partial [Tissierellaceae bacterium]|nr:hypothetical protein [Tissierellaceae bacterium]